MTTLRVHKSVFISYRREASRWFAHSVYTAILDQKFDIFMDVKNVDAGKFEEQILSQIEERAHFLAILSNASLPRLKNPDDWLRKEILHAMKYSRNIIPVLHNKLTMEAAALELPPELESLCEYQAIRVHLNINGSQFWIEFEKFTP